MTSNPTPLESAKELLRMKELAKGGKIRFRSDHLSFCSWEKPDELWDFMTYAARNGDEIATALIAVTAERDALREALDALVYLKRHKDKEGKTHYYQQEQPKAWEAARAALKQPAEGDERVD